MARGRSFRFALDGLWHMLRFEHNARIHACATLAAVLVCAGLGLRAEDWRWIVLMIGLVWICEALNTALEAVCDTLSPAPHHGVRVAKDVAAGAVLVSALVAVVIGGLTIWPYLRW